MGCGGTQTGHLLPQRQKGSSGNFLSGLWACRLVMVASLSFGGHILDSHCCHFLPLHPCSL